MVETVPPQRVAALISGGLDSSVLLCELAGTYSDVFPVYIKSGLVWEKIELYWAKRFLRKVTHPAVRSIKMISLPVRDLYHEHWSITGHNVPGYSAALASNYLPGRNIMLLAKTTVYCALNSIGTAALGLLKGNPFPDSTPPFFHAFERAIAEGLQFDFKLIAPFSKYGKADVIRLGKDLPLELTFSCIKPVARYHCGQCTKCAERQAAFREAGIEDKTVYSNQGEETWR